MRLQEDRSRLRRNTLGARPVAFRNVENSVDRSLAARTDALMASIFIDAWKRYSILLCAGAAMDSSHSVHRQLVTSHLGRRNLNR